MDFERAYNSAMRENFYVKLIKTKNVPVYPTEKKNTNLQKLY
jgi:hypothetical protein